MRFHLPDDHGLTPAEIQSLRLVAARARMDQGDLYGMRRVWVGAHDAGEEVIPWREAVDMEVGTDD